MKLVAIVLCVFLAVSLCEAGKQKKKGKRLPGVACGLKCKEECSENRSCKKKCIRTNKGKERKTCLKGCNQGQQACHTCKRTCFDKARQCASQNCPNCPNEESVGPRKYKIKHPECYQCLVANCLAYEGE